MRLSNRESYKTNYKKRNYVLKVYCRRCRHNNPGVCRKTRIVVSTVEKMGISLGTVPIKKLTRNRRVSTRQEKTSWLANT